MKCSTCGFAASDASVTVCPFCKTQSAASPGGTLAAAAQGGTAVWPPAPAAALPLGYAGPEIVDREALLKQRHLGATLSWCGFGASILSSRVHGTPVDLLVLASLGLYCVGYGHYAASKGYPRWMGWLLTFVLFFGGLILRLLPDKNKLG